MLAPAGRCRSIGGQVRSVRPLKLRRCATFARAHARPRREPRDASGYAPAEGGRQVQLGRNRYTVLLWRFQDWIPLQDGLCSTLSGVTNALPSASDPGFWDYN